MTPTKLLKALLFPHIAVMIPLVPISAFLLVYSMVFVGTESIAAYISYVISAYTLTVWCVRIPDIIRFFKDFRIENKYARLLIDDRRLRTNVTLYGSMIWNGAYAVFQLCLGIFHSSFWFCSISMYYLFLAFMRLSLASYLQKNSPGERICAELKRYRACGVLLLLINLALSLMIFFMIYWGRTFHHHEITTIAMAAYTFTAFTMAIVNIIKYKKYNSPVYSATKVISLASACVSMLTLESTMLTTFGGESLDLLSQRIFLAVSGGAISAFIITIALYMIIQSNKKLRTEKESDKII